MLAGWLLKMRGSGMGRRVHWSIGRVVLHKITWYNPNVDPTYFLWRLLRSSPAEARSFEDRNGFFIWLYPKSLGNASKFELSSFFLYPEPWFYPFTRRGRTEQNIAFQLIQEEFIHERLSSQEFWYGMNKVCYIHFQIRLLLTLNRRHRRASHRRQSPRTLLHASDSILSFLIDWWRWQCWSKLHQPQANKLHLEVFSHEFSAIQIFKTSPRCTLCISPITKVYKPSVIISSNIFWIEALHLIFEIEEVM